MNRLWKPISLAAGMLLLSGILMWAGCASGGGKTRFRFMNAMPDQNSLNILINPTVNTTPVFSNIAYGTASAYTAVSSGSQPFEIEAAGTTNSLKVLLTSLTEKHWRRDLHTHSTNKHH